MTRRFVLTSFRRGSDEFVQSVDLPGMRVEEARKLAGMSPTDPMADCYPLSAEAAGIAAARAGIPFEGVTLDYFLEAQSSGR